MTTPNEFDDIQTTRPADLAADQRFPPDPRWEWLGEFSRILSGPIDRVSGQRALAILDALISEPLDRRLGDTERRIGARFDLVLAETTSNLSPQLLERLGVDEIRLMRKGPER